MEFQLTLLGLIGLVMGSFMGLVSLRLPRDEDVVVRRSHCATCHKDLKPWHLVPLFSYLVSRGRCAQCAAPIPIRYPLFEAASAAIGLWAAWISPDFTTGLMTAIFGWNLLLIAVVDGEHFWIPDLLTIPLFITSLIAALVLYPAGLAEAFPLALLPPLLGAALGFGGLWFIACLYRLVRKREGLGGGDPILFGAIGAWVGWAALPTVLLYASLSGLGVALTRILMRKKVSTTDALPFGVFLAIGAWLTYLYGALNLAP